MAFLPGCIVELRSMRGGEESIEKSFFRWAGFLRERMGIF